jgi:hypothetical protein
MVGEHMLLTIPPTLTGIENEKAALVFFILFIVLFLSNSD